MSHSHITIRGARTHNLAGLDLDIPRGLLVAVVGVSGSGKSSLVFGTLAAEAGHQMNETYPPFTRNRLPKWRRPDVEHLAGLSPVVVIDQRRIGGNARSTVGTITDTWTYLRLIYSRLSTPHVGESTAFSFNDPSGMCPVCTGLGETVTSDVDAILDLDRSLDDGAIRLPGFGEGDYWYQKYADIGSFDSTTPLRDWTTDERQALLYGGEAAARLGSGTPKDYEGLIERFERIYLHTADNLSDRKRAVIAEFTRTGVCPECEGERLNEAARTAKIHDTTIAELSRMEVTELAAFIDHIDAGSVAPAVAALRARVSAMITIGLGYLTLARGTPTLSGGESQRIKMVKHLGSSLTEMIYVIDEPSVGLHPADVSQMTDILVGLRDAGNTVLVVEHDTAVMARADQIIEVGPGGGADGGHLVFQGTVGELREADTPTGAALRQRPALRPGRRRPRGELRVDGAARNNLRHIDVSIGVGVLTAFTGVAGSGKSSLASEIIDRFDAVVVDQKPVSTSRRSTPITYTGIAPSIRRMFAAASGLPTKMFSANSDGGCPACRGLGTIYTDLAFMEGQETVCDECGGLRFRPETLAHRVEGLTVAEVENLTVTQASRLLPSAEIADRLGRLADVGLGYLTLGQSLSSLSGGECQRVKIARELHEQSEPTVYVLDEPTTGLHRRDVNVLLAVLDRLVDAGHTVIVIEHDMEVVARADRLVDLGPGPGRHGGTVLYQGSPVDYLDADTPTSRALASLT